MLLNFFGRYFYLILYFGEFSVEKYKLEKEQSINIEGQKGNNPHIS